MRQIRMVRELKSPPRDLPADIILSVGRVISADVADELVRNGYAVEHVAGGHQAPPGGSAPQPQAPKRRKRGEG